MAKKNDSGLVQDALIPDEMSPLSLLDFNSSCAKIKQAAVDFRRAVNHKMQLETKDAYLDKFHQIDPYTEGRVRHGRARAAHHRLRRGSSTGCSPIRRTHAARSCTTTSTTASPRSRKARPTIPIPTTMLTRPTEERPSIRPPARSSNYTLREAYMQQANKKATRNRGWLQEKMWSISALRRLIGWHDVYGFCVHIRHKAVRHSVIVVDAHKFIVLTICRQFDELAQLTERKLLEINRHTHMQRWVFLSLLISRLSHVVKAARHVCELRQHLRFRSCGAGQQHGRARTVRDDGDVVRPPDIHAAGLVRRHLRPQARQKRGRHRQTRARTR